MKGSERFSGAIPGKERVEGEIKTQGFNFISNFE